MRDEVMPLQYRAFYFIHSRSKDTPSSLPPCFRASWKSSIIDAGKWHRAESDTQLGLYLVSGRGPAFASNPGRRQHAEGFMG
jgi:hypothetical protein